MIATPKHKHQDVNNRGNREYWRREKALVEQPGPPVTDVVNSKES
jgi:hypothetical protein